MRLSGILAMAAPLALILATAPPARAELTEEGKRVEKALFEVMSLTDSYKEGADSYGTLAGLLEQPTIDCEVLVEQGKRAGIAPGDKLRGYPDPYLFKRAPELVCGEYAKWRLLGEAAVVLYEAQKDHGIVTSMKPGEVTGTWAMDYDAKGKACHAAIDKLATRGLASDVPVKVNGEVATVTALRATYCQGLIAWAAQFAVATDAARKAEADALRGKYTKLGAKGDRLAYLMEADRRTLYGKGCGELEPAGRVKAAVLYEVWEDDAKWTVWKTTFKNDKKVASKSKNFSKRVTSDWRCW